MNNVIVILISLLIGFATAGIVWYCWSLCTNLHSIRENKKAPLNNESENDEEVVNS